MQEAPRRNEQLNSTSMTACKWGSGVPREYLNRGASEPTIFAYAARIPNPGDVKGRADEHCNDLQFENSTSLVRNAQDKAR